MNCVLAASLKSTTQKFYSGIRQHDTLFTTQSGLSLALPHRRLHLQTRPGVKNEAPSHAESLRYLKATANDSRVVFFPNRSTQKIQGKDKVYRRKIKLCDRCAQVRTAFHSHTKQLTSTKPKWGWDGSAGRSNYAWADCHHHFQDQATRRVPRHGHFLDVEVEVVGLFAAR